MSGSTRGRGKIRALLGALGVGTALLFSACSQGQTPTAGTAVEGGKAGVDPYAGGVSYPWSDRIGTVTGDPYAGGRSYPWASPRGSAGGLSRLANTTTAVSDLTWVSATNAWGPVEKNTSNGEQNGGDGRPLTVGGVVFPSGLGVHAGSELVYAIGGSCSTFTASVGVDDEVGNLGSVNFQVWNAGTKLYDSGVLRGSDAAKPVTVDVTGVNTLRLVVTDGGDGINYDHADWGERS